MHSRQQTKLAQAIPAIDLDAKEKQLQKRELQSVHKYGKNNYQMGGSVWNNNAVFDTKLNNSGICTDLTFFLYDFTQD